MNTHYNTLYAVIVCSHEEEEVPCELLFNLQRSRDHGHHGLCP